MASRSVVSPMETRSFPAVKTESYASGVSWAAVIAGAFVAAALSLILLALGTGFGLSATSPWSNANALASRVGVGAILWLIVVQIIAFGIGGYLAGRLRTKWVEVHTNEVYFRDTAHGLLVWSVGVVITAAFLASATMSVLGRTQPTTAQGSLDPNAYYVDMLLRSPATPVNDAPLRAEIARILDRSLQQSEANAADQNYLSQVVAARTALSRREAETRVSNVLTQARQAADCPQSHCAFAVLDILGITDRSLLRQLRGNIWRQAT